MTLEEYKQKPYNKQLWTLTVEYISKCTNQQAFTNKKPNSLFWAIRSFFIKLEPSELPVLYGYISNIEDKECMTLTELFHNAERLNQQKHIENISNNDIGDYARVDLNKWLSE